MSRFSALIFIALLVITTSESRVSAQIVTVTPNGVQGGIGTTPSAQPSGSISVPIAVPMPIYIVEITYGELLNGVFFPWAGGPAPYSVTVNTNAPGGGPHKWQAPQKDQLKIPFPRPLFVRARLLRETPAGSGQFQEVHAAYAQVFP